MSALAAYPVYYAYIDPKDCWNDWKVIVQTAPRTFLGVRWLWPNGELGEHHMAGAFLNPSPLWKKITLQEAITLAGKK